MSAQLKVATENSPVYIVLVELEIFSHTWIQDCYRYVAKPVNLSFWPYRNELRASCSFNRCSWLAFLVTWQTEVTAQS